MSEEVGASIGLAQYAISIPQDYAILIRQEHGSITVLKQQSAEILITPILSFDSHVSLIDRDNHVQYSCEMIPKVNGSMTHKKFPRTLSDELLEAVKTEFEEIRKAEVIGQSPYDRKAEMDFTWKGLDFTCLIYIPLGEEFWQEVVAYYKPKKH